MNSEKTNDKNSKDRELDCQMCEKLEKYKILYQAYADEIRNLWQRSVFLGAFMVLVWTGYGALQLKFIDNAPNISGFVCSVGVKISCDLQVKNIVNYTLNTNDYYLLISIGLCAVIIVLSLLWIAMAKGSKFIQKAHEKHIENFIEKKDELQDLFCRLGDYEKELEKELCSDLVFCGTLKAYRYSPSKINIGLGWVSLFISFVLLNIHIFSLFGVSNLEQILTQINWIDKIPLPNILTITLIVFILALFCVVFMYWLIYIAFKGGKNKNSTQGAKNANKL